MRVATTRGSGPRVVLVHGFTQTASSWNDIAPALAEAGFEVVTVDAPGHGIAAEVRATLVGGADRLAGIGGPAHYVGYSMGGRFCLHLALQHPQVVRSLVLLSSTPGIEDPSERASRRRSDEQLAAALERGGVEEFLTRWLAQPMFSGVPADAPGNDDRRTNSAAGLASSLRLAGTGTQQSLWPRLTELRGHRTLLLAGERDPKFVEIALRTQVPAAAALQVLPDAGHAAHLERPADFLAAVTRFLTTQPSPEPPFTP